MSDEEGAIWYHGTDTKKKCLSILRKGFKPYTYFTPYLDSAIGYGGKYVFAIYFEKAPTTYWEWRNGEIIPSDRILWVKKFSYSVEYLNKDAIKKMEDLIHLENNPGKTICSQCDGYGEHRKEKYRYRYIYQIGGGSFRTRRDKCIICENCNGTGVI
jgi:hypothetical protein